MPLATDRLLQAIDSGNLKEVQELISEDSSLLNKIIRPGKNRDYRSLTEAAVECQLDILAFFIESGSRVEEDDRYPMFRAALYDRCVPALEMLVHHGATINGVWADYGPPLIASCEGRSLATMKWLLENGAQITGTAQGKSKQVSWNALTHASYFDKHRRGLLALLLEYGADVNSKHPDGGRGLQSTALHGVAQKGDVTGVRFLLNNGADPTIKNSDDQLPIDVTRNKQVRALIEG